MGLTYTTKAWKADCKTPADKLVLLALADFTNNQTGECWPGLATIAAMTGVSARGVRKSLRRLEGTYIRTQQGGGAKITNRYFLTFKNTEHSSGLETPQEGASAEPGTERPITRNCVPPNPEQRDEKPGTVFPRSVIIRNSDPERTGKSNSPSSFYFSSEPEFTIENVLRFTRDFKNERYEPAAKEWFESYEGSKERAEWRGPLREHLHNLPKPW